MTNGRVAEVVRFPLLSPWIGVLPTGALVGIGFEFAGGWSFLEAFHPVVLGAMSVGLTLWALFALVPKITVHAMRGVDILPRGDSAVPVAGTIVRFFTVILGPMLAYLSFMTLREESASGWKVMGAAFIGLVLGALVYRNITLLRIMVERFPEDEIRKGLLDTGAYPKEAITKLKQANRDILADGNFDRKRIRLRRLAATDRVLRNKNYDPHQFEHGTTAGATLGGFEREQDLVRARRDAEFEDVEFETKISEQKAKQRHFDNLNSSKAAPTPETLRSRIRRRINSAVGAHQAAEDLCDDEEERCQRAGWDEDRIARHMARFRAAAVQAAEEEANWQ